jgi:AraC-like DNA-binding protein
MMRYRERPPLPALAHAVDRIWTLEAGGQADAASEPILPDGRPELLLHLGDPFELVAEDGGASKQAPILFAGQMPSRLLLRPTGRTSVVGVRFHAYGAAALMPMPQHELAGVPCGLDTLHPRLRRDLAAVRSYAGDPDAVVTAVQQVLLRWMAPEAADARVRLAVDAIAGARGQVSIDRQAAAANVTRRHLERRFLETVGVTPKRFARIARFQHALQLLDRAGAASSGAHTAARCGYADQSHFVRDFRQLAGCPPSAHLLQKAAMTGFFMDRAG